MIFARLAGAPLMEACMWNSRKKQARHRCSKRTPGQPKIGRGFCYGFREAVKQRIESKQLARAWTHWVRTNCHLDDVEV